ncbi:MAG TPA: hypothetical protein VKU89_08200 [Solirubrobacteraceae bacterium]|nr:hypothetical protein [Solirubrobacteraceae bacterium]
MQSSRLRKSLSLVGALGASALLAACGNANERQTSGTYAGEGGVPAPYLSVGQLAYQVQISRELNPSESEDQAYLEGVPAGDLTVRPGEEWFMISLQVYNSTSRPQPSSPDIYLEDSEGDVYRPVVPDNTNLFAYRARNVPGNGRLPEPGTIASQGPTQGAILLFKLRLASLSNRPIDIRIVNPAKPSESAKAELDV